MKSTKTKLISSVTVLLICFAMLIGSTFAWFTDSASTGVNKIQAGNLDIEAYYQDAVTEVNSTTVTIPAPEGFTRSNNFIFDGSDKSLQNAIIINEDKWEPGKVGARLITVKNNGNLDAKIKLDFITSDEGLESALWFDFVMVGSNNNAIGQFNCRPMSTLQLTAEQTGYLSLPNNEELKFILVYGMYETAGNEYQNKSFSATVNITATQLNSEEDSFGKDYDIEAPYTVYEASTPAEFVAAVNATDEYILVNLTGNLEVNISEIGTQTPGSGEYKLGGENTKEILITSSHDNTLTLQTTYMSALGMKNESGKLVFKNITLNSIGNNASTWNIYDFQIINCNLTMDNVTINKALAINNSGKNSVLNNVEINETNSTGDAYALWICAGSDVTLNNCTINSVNPNEGIQNRAIKIADQYIWEGEHGSLPSDQVPLTKLSVTKTTFKSEKKAAVLVTSIGGADIIWGEGNNIAGVAADSTNAVWNDSARTTAWDLVTVTGCIKDQERN